MFIVSAVQISDQLVKLDVQFDHEGLTYNRVFSFRIDQVENVTEQQAIAALKNKVESERQIIEDAKNKVQALFDALKNKDLDLIEVG
jgi:hypothetical protein